MVTVVENGYGDLSSNLGTRLFNFHIALIPLGYVRIQQFNIDKVTDQGERKLWIQTSKTVIKIYLVSHSSGWESFLHTHIHTHTHIYIYIYIYIPLMTVLTTMKSSGSSVFLVCILFGCSSIGHIFLQNFLFCVCTYTHTHIYIWQKFKAKIIILSVKNPQGLCTTIQSYI